ncbi:alpha/beta fold hydrolase [Schlesneria sp. DSM 10557]|uniref:alpha/beta fold hydrolase n=1 Tax=Schlesneria sp. DSM 10557 TaxID=3044399 RepID=UPI0035A0E51A
MNSESAPGSRDTQAPLILLPGLGGDSRMFRPQRVAFPDLIVPEWIEPLPREPLVEYAARLAKEIDPGKPCYIGGVSFGGVVALELATHLNARECFLIGSIRSHQELPRRLAMFRPVSSLVMVPKWLAPFVLGCFGGYLPPLRRGVLHQLNDAEGRFLRWAAQAILRWKPSKGVENLRVFQIHGDQDLIFPPQLTRADRVIAGAGHLVSMTHSAAVNGCLRERMTFRDALPGADSPQGFPELD